MVPRTEPQVGQVVEHYYLWHREHAAGLREGRKPRPCIVVAVERRGAAQRVVVVPVTTQRPHDETVALRIPSAVGERIGVGGERESWVVVDEANVFDWPGYDLVPSQDGGFARGVVTRGFFEALRRVILAQRPPAVPRD